MESGLGSVVGSDFHQDFAERVFAFSGFVAYAPECVVPVVSFLQFLGPGGFELGCEFWDLEFGFAEDVHCGDFLVFPGLEVEVGQDSSFASGSFGFAGCVFVGDFLSGFFAVGFGCLECVFDCGVNDSFEFDWAWPKVA